LQGTLEGTLADWDYSVGASLNKNEWNDNIAGYSNGPAIKAGFLNGTLNPFGDQTSAGNQLLDAAALSGNLQNAVGKTYIVDAHASRELSDWFKAGRSAAIAIGAEARHESLKTAANPDFAAKVVSSTGIDPSLDNEGKRDIRAVFAELSVPLTKTLDVTAAVRYDKYNDFGSTTNPKYSFRYQPVQAVLLRGSYSTGFRAPSLYELYSGQTYTNTNQQNDPINCPGGVPVAGKPSATNCKQQFQTLTGGNTSLKPETATNTTLGLVVEPVKNLTLEMDYWSVELKQSIGAIAADTIFSQYQTFANLFHRNAAGDLSTDGSLCPGASCGYVDTRTQNLGGTKTNGFDYAITYAQKTADLGDFTYSLHSTLVSNFVYQNFQGDVWNQNVGVFSGTGPVFRWQHNLGVNWNKGDYSAGVAVHYKTGYLDQDGKNNVKDYFTTDLYGTWNAMKSLSLTAGVRNLFDREPPFSTQTQTFVGGGFDPRFYDLFGRTFYLRGTYKF